MSPRVVAAVVLVILVQAAYLRHVEQRHRVLLDEAMGHLEDRVVAVETSVAAQLSPTSGWRRDAKRRLKRIERCCCPGDTT